MDFDYPVELTPDGDTILVTFPDVPEAITFGADEAEALLQACDALATALAMYVEGQRDLPKPSPANGRQTVRPDALECAKLGIYVAMREQGVRKAELARRLHWHMPQVDRLLDLNHASRLAQIEQAAASLGKRVEMRVT
jgi:antitoxin HicB